MSLRKLAATCLGLISATLILPQPTHARPLSKKACIFVNPVFCIPKAEGAPPVVRQPPGPGVYHSPRRMGSRINYCTNGNCDITSRASVASAFCEDNGHGKAIAWDVKKLKKIQAFKRKSAWVFDGVGKSLPPVNFWRLEHNKRRWFTYIECET